MNVDYTKHHFYMSEQKGKEVVSYVRKETSIVKLGKKKEKGKTHLLRICYFPDFSTTCYYS